MVAWRIAPKRLVVKQLATNLKTIVARKMPVAVKTVVVVATVAREENALVTNANAVTVVRKMPVAVKTVAVVVTVARTETAIAMNANVVATVVDSIPDPLVDGKESCEFSWCFVNHQSWEFMQLLWRRSCRGRLATI